MNEPLKKKNKELIKLKKKKKKYLDNIQLSINLMDKEKDMTNFWISSIRPMLTRKCIIYCHCIPKLKSFKQYTYINVCIYVYILYTHNILYINCHAHPNITRYHSSKIYNKLLPQTLFAISLIIVKLLYIYVYIFSIEL